jgi:hypothetical protein
VSSFLTAHCYLTAAKKVDPNAPVANLADWDVVLKDGTRTDTKFPKWLHSQGIAQKKKEEMAAANSNTPWATNPDHPRKSVVYGATAAAEEVCPLLD